MGKFASWGVFDNWLLGINEGLTHSSLFFPSFFNSANPFDANANMSVVVVAY